MERIRKNYSPAFKTKVALEAVKEVTTMVAHVCHLISETRMNKG